MTALIGRNLIVGLIGAALIYIFWLARPQWSADMRFWRAVGDGSLILLYMGLALGPMARFVPRVGMLLPYRRELGIWFGIYAILHTIIILDGWVLWDFYQFMGYQYIPAIDQTVRMESGFGMANILGLMAVLIALPLMATSTDWATRALGASAWKFLHYGAYIIFLRRRSAYRIFHVYPLHDVIPPDGPGPQLVPAPIRALDRNLGLAAGWSFYQGCSQRPPVAPPSLAAYSSERDLST